MQQWSEASDLPALAGFCQLLADTPAALRIVFIHAEPRSILSPVRHVLDDYDTTLETFSESHPIERYGVLVLFLQVACARFDLFGDLSHHLGSERGFCRHWLGSVSAVYTLHSLDDAGKTAVNGWIGGLFGEGISDELIK